MLGPRPRLIWRKNALCYCLVVETKDGKLDSSGRRKDKD
jgi:hypothetical protein